MAQHGCFPKFYVLLLATLVLSFCIPSFGQSENATLSGTITDPTGAIVQGAQVKLTNVNTGITATVPSNDSGLYVFSNVHPGQYRMVVEKAGFRQVVLTDLTLNVQDVLSRNFKLQLGVVGESVTVSGTAETLNTVSAAVSTVVNRQFVESIPLNGRSFQDLISMTPGVVTQSPQSGSALGWNGDFSVNGQRTESNYYTVDGVSANTTSGDGSGLPGAGTGGSLGGSTALGTTQSLVSVDALEEFRVQSSTYSAEFGRSPGGQFSLVTRSGTNDFHGTLFDYLRNNFFDANDWFNNYYGQPAPALRQNDFGGTAGGPVWIPKLLNGKNRTFFFVSYEGLRLSQPTAAQIQYVPDNFMRQQAVPSIQAIWNSFPVQNGVDYGTSASPSLAQFIKSFFLPSGIDSTSVRVDHTLSPKLSLFFRYADTSSFASSRSFAVLTKRQANIEEYTLGATSQLTSKLSNSFRLGYDRTNLGLKSTNDNFGGATTIDLSNAMGTGGFANAYPVIYLSISGIGSSTYATPNSAAPGRQWNMVNTVSFTTGNHQLKFGVDYRRIKSPLMPGDPEPFGYFFSTGAMLNNAAEFSFIFRNKSSTPIFNETGVYVQDQWTVSPKVSISAGLRWDVNPPPREQHGNDAYTLTGSIANPSTLALAPEGTPLWKTTWYNFAPRLGAAWSAHSTPNHETIVRAGGGVFYDTLNQVAALGYFGLGFSAFKFLSGVPVPYTPAQLSVPLSVSPPYTSAAIYAFPSHMQLPYTLQWNVSLQQALGKSQALNISYVGSNGRRLIGTQFLSLGALNPNFGSVVYFPGGITSNYQALQLQFQRSVASGIQALASYTWSHSIDYGSSSGALPLTRGSSDYDVRHNLQAGLTWTLPKVTVNKLTSALVNGWGVDGRLMARTAFPVFLLGYPFVDPTTGSLNYAGLDLVPNQPFYLYGSQYPGNRVINRAAFAAPLTGIMGNAPRNFMRGFGANQINVSARREFALGEKAKLEFRAETFNLLNHPNFGLIDANIADTTFGQATQMLNSSLGTVAPQYQQGGPRSMQFALKLKF